MTERKKPTRPTLPSAGRRRFLAGTGAAASISVLEWLGFFRNHGVPGSAKDWGIAKARAQEDGGVGMPDEPRFLIYWFVEGGWMSYSMFSPVDTPNHVTLDIPANTLTPSPPWSQQRYRVTSRETPMAQTTVTGNIRHGYLAAPGAELFPDLCVVASHHGNTFHSGGRFDFHYGRYNRSMTAAREDDERTVLQAFCEEKGASMLLPHISWHRWLADGELDPAQYPEGTGYYEKLGPAYAHTVYGRTPADFKNRLAALGDVATAARRQLIRNYTDGLHDNLIASRDGQSVRSFASALEIHRQLSGGSLNVDLTTLFEDPVLKEEFGILLGDELPTYRSVNGNPARSKDIPHVRMQAMMAYELMRAGVSCGFWIESRDVRAFDHHRSRANVMNANTHPDQLDELNADLWDPLKSLVARLKSTPMPGMPGRSLYDQTTIVLCSEMGRTIQGDVEAILTAEGTVDEKYTQILEQDVCQHWRTSSVAFLGGNVRAHSTFGRVGTSTLDAIPLLPDGGLHPAYDPVTGILLPGQAEAGVIPDAGHVYSTALYLSGVDPTGKGRNTRPPLTFVHK